MGLFDLLTSSRAFRDAADCLVHVDGEELAELYPFLREVSAECAREGASTARLVFETRRDERGRWIVQDSGLLATWKAIVIEVSFGRYTEELFRGYIREVHADYPADPGTATVTIECQDESIALDREHVRRPWGVDVAVDDGLIVDELARRHGLAVVRGSGRGRDNLVLLQDTTDIRFLQARAEANGYELYVRGGAVYFGPMRLDAEAQAPIRVYAGPDTNCLSLAIRSDGHRPDAVALDLAPTRGTEVIHKELAPDLPVLGTTPATAGGAGLRDFTWRLSRDGSLDEAELTGRAQQRVNELSLRVTADGELDGTLYGHVLLPGLPVIVDGTGPRLGGVYYVDSVTHLLSTEGYRQQIRLLRNAYGDAAGGLPGASRFAGIL